MDAIKVPFQVDVLGVFRQPLLEPGPSELHPFFLPIRKGNELPLLQPKEHIRPYFAHFPFPYGHTGIKVDGMASVDAGGRFFHQFKKALIVLGRFGVVHFSKKLVGKVT